MIILPPPILSAFNLKETSIFCISFFEIFKIQFLKFLVFLKIVYLVLKWERYYGIVTLLRENWQLVTDEPVEFEI